MKTPTSIGILASYRTPECMQALQVFEEECAAAGISAYEIGPHTRVTHPARAGHAAVLRR